MSNGMRQGIVWAATVAVSTGGFASTAQGAMDEHFQSHALRYAGMIERAYGAAARFHPSPQHRGWCRGRAQRVPPAWTGWEAGWTDAGLRGALLRQRASRLLRRGGGKGGSVGAHRAIQQARRSFLPERERGVKLSIALVARDEPGGRRAR